MKTYDDDGLEGAEDPEDDRRDRRAMRALWVAGFGCRRGDVDVDGGREEAGGEGRGE